MNDLKPKILVIEDNLLNLDMACDLLELEGFETLRAEEALAGIEIAKRENPALILMDLHLPKIDGFRATEIIKNDPFLKDIPIVAFTALAMRGDREKALAKGCSGYISKPIDVAQFGETVRGYLNGVELETPIKPSSDSSERRATTSLTSLDYSRSAPKEKMAVAEEVPVEKHRILVVDDNMMNVELLKDALESMGQSVLAAYSGQEATHLVRQEMPDLILLDIMMPDMDGYDVLEQLKKDPLTHDIPVIFVSALDKTRDIVRGFELGTYDYITKPFKIEEVKARVLSVLRLKDAQEALRTERDKLDRIFQFSMDGILLLDEHFQVNAMNPVASKWFNASLHSDGKPLRPIHFNTLVGCQCLYQLACPIHMPHLILAPPVAQENVSKEDTVLSHIAVKIAEDSLRYLDLRCGNIPKSFLHSAEYVVILRDVTEEKLIEQRKETFVATLTHDLKTPIRAEQRALELLKEESFGSLNVQQKDVIQEILQSNRFMYQMIDSLLTTYKYEDGQMRLNFELLDLNHFIQTILSGDLKTLAEEKKHQLIFTPQSNLPSIYVDSIELRRVMNNLVHNAILYTSAGGTITLKTEDTKEGSLKVIIEDTGKGIPLDFLPHVFERYWSFTKKFRQVGTGLGLYLSRQIIEAHGGQIGVESTVDKGSKFFFTLPLTPSPKLSPPSHPKTETSLEQASAQ